MKSLSCVLLAGLSFAATSVGVPHKPNGPFCATGEPLKGLLDLHRQRNGSVPENSQRRAQPSPFHVDIDVYMFSILRSTSDASLTFEQVQTQMQVLNDSFKKVGFTFLLRDMLRIHHPDWPTNETARDESMYRMLHRGDYTSLNVYFVEKVDDMGALGSATFPISGKCDEHGWFRDGVVMQASAIANSVGDPPRSGKALVHEVGHWCGLLHTHSTSCSGDDSGDGDFIDDTPVSIVQLATCEEGLDTCPNQPGLDPIHNHMSYSNEYVFLP
ncbi:hypothetical protein C2857_005926 [Epichloe festucae Fl1]|uniref:Peptidase M43 pregnancy-associated plasma-A domain-containing protein n=1 Tax=Epichloe festucae (strain Fl1) TaxID=877507 RepID=A0A7S9PU84_EPIFF|nr:hypothetical protein C2857_005926 [Epichloe festucae Fl1]